MALAWLHQPAVTSAIIGPRTAERLSAAQRALEITLDDAALQRLDEVSARTGRRAAGICLVNR